MRKVFLLTIFFFILLLGCTNNIVKDKVVEEEIEIGFIAPLTGPFVDWGNSIREGMILALEDTGHNFKVDFQDSACDAK